MVCYNTTFHLDSDVSSQWILWMKAKYIPLVVNSGFFTGYKFYYVVTNESESGGKTYSFQLFCETIELLNQYIEQHSRNDDQILMAVFGDHLVKFSLTLYEI